MNSFGIQNELVTDADGRIEYWKPDTKSREHFHLRVYFKASPDVLDNVESVSYKLHDSFRYPDRSSSDRENAFSIDVWTWGMFMISVVVHWKDGSTKRTQHYLSYELPPNNGSNYIATRPRPTE